MCRRKTERIHTHGELLFVLPTSLFVPKPASMAPSLPLLVLMVPALAGAQATPSGSPALRGAGSNGSSPVAAGSEMRAVAAQSDDPCFIHEGCDSSPGYSDSGSMGPGWYCSDGMYVDGNTKLDGCHIHSNCQSGAKWDGSRWVCSDDNPGGGIFGQQDSCYIHENCQAGVAYSNDNTASLGNGWYCSDGQYVDANTAFDMCHIHKNCACGASFQFNMWRCDC